MSAVETAILAACIAIGLAGGSVVWRYCHRRIEAAERLRAQGWICVGFSFVAGPLMVPPPSGLIPRPEPPYTSRQPTKPGCSRQKDKGPAD